MSADKDRYLADLKSANSVIEKADSFLVDPDDPEWLGVDPTKVSEQFMSYYSGLVSVGYANGFI